MKKLGIFYLLIATFTYGILQVIDKVVLNSQVDSTVYTLSRVFISMFFIASLIKVRRKHSLLSSLKKENIKDLVIIGVLASGIGLLFQIIGLSLTTATNTSILLTLVAPFTSIFASFFIKESLPKSFLLAILLMLFGSFLVMYKPLSPFTLGDILVFGAVIGYAYSNVHARKTMKNIPTAIVTFGRLLFGSLSIIMVMPLLKLSFVSLFNAPLWVIIGGTIFGIRMLSYYKGVEIEGASVAATFLLFSPAITIVFAHLFLSEPFTLGILIGLIFILIGGLLLTRAKLRYQITGESE